MKDLLDDWAFNPMEFVGMVFCCSIPVMLAVALGLGCVGRPYEPTAVLVFEWAANVFGGSMLAAMVVGTVDGQSPGSARSLMPIYCLLGGAFLLWLARGSLAAETEISAGRVGAVYLLLGGVLVIANAQQAVARSLQRARVR